jgi:hypothetical protein
MIRVKMGVDKVVDHYLQTLVWNAVHVVVDVKPEAPGSEYFQLIPRSVSDTERVANVLRYYEREFQLTPS